MSFGKKINTKIVINPIIKDNLIIQFKKFLPDAFAIRKDEHKTLIDANTQIVLVRDIIIVKIDIPQTINKTVLKILFCIFLLLSDIILKLFTP